MDWMSSRHGAGMDSSHNLLVILRIGKEGKANFILKKFRVCWGSGGQKF